MTNLKSLLAEASEWMNDHWPELPNEASTSLRERIDAALAAAEPSLAERETAIRQIPSARGDIAASGPRNGPSAEPTRERQRFTGLEDGECIECRRPWAEHGKGNLACPAERDYSALNRPGDV